MLTQVRAVCFLLLSLFFFFPAFAQTAPSITTLSPSVGSVSPAGGPVTIQGANFGTQPGTVTFGGTAVTVTSWSNTSIVVTLPTTLPVGFLNVLVTVNGDSSNAQSFLLIPTILSDSPSQATVGTPITITGTSFGAQQGSSTVTFNGITATATSWSNTSITATVPTGASDGALVVTVNGFQTNGVQFYIVPNILSLTPSSGPVGTPVTIAGNGFGTSQGFGGVTFNGTSATITTWSDTSISVAVPPGATTGSVVVTASSFIAGAGLNFTVPPLLISLAITPANPSIALSSTQALRLSALGNYSDGSQQDLTARVTWGTSNSSVALVAPFLGVAGVVELYGAGTATITASTGSISARTVVTVTPPPTPVSPAIAAISPTSGVAGTQVTVTGSNFGTQQGTGTVWLGTTLGTVASWSDTQVIATVSTGSASGTAIIQQGGGSSNAVPFTVSTPAIQTASPNSGLPGAQVTITGSAFGTTQGSGQVWLGTAPASVSSWSDTQVVATVAAGSTSGVAQILQSGVLSNAVSFTVNTPQINTVTPTSGTVGTSVTISGSGFGASEGSGVVWIGSAPGNVVSWSDTQVQATVASTAVGGVVRIQQNGIWSNALTFTVPPSIGTNPSVTIIPNLISMVVGDTRPIQAFDTTGKAIAGLTWTSSDTTLATLSTDDPPFVTAVAPGHVTITAGNAATDITIYPGPALPQGTIQWSVPADSSGVSHILPAVPSDTGVADVFAQLGDGNVQAITDTGSVAWTANLGSAPDASLPDFLGGLVAVYYAGNGSLQRLDGMTGQAGPTYNFHTQKDLFGNTITGEPRPVRVFPDGTIVAVDGDQVVGIDPTTMQARFTVLLDDSTLSFQSNCSGGSASSAPPRTLSLIIAGDGYAYLAYQNTVENDITDCSVGHDVDYTHFEEHTKVLRVGSAGDSSSIRVNDFAGDHQFDHGSEISYDVRSGYNATSTALITNADQGVVFPLSLYDFTQSSDPVKFTLAQVSGRGSVSQISLNMPNQVTAVTAMLQAADGSFVGTVGTGPNPRDVTQYNMISFDLSGNVRWSVPGNYTPQMATADGGLIAGNVRFDQTGQIIGEIPSPLTESWTGATYAPNGVATESVFGFTVDYANSFAAVLGGNNSANGTAIPQPPFAQLDSCIDSKALPPPPCPGLREAIWNAEKGLVKNLSTTDCGSAAQTWVFDKLTQKPGIKTKNFLDYLQGKQPQIYDGTKSIAPLTTLCQGESGFAYANCKFQRYLMHAQTVADYFAQNSGSDPNHPLQLFAVTIGGNNPLIVFYRPSFISLSSNGNNVQNRASVFHEALHGFTDLTDNQLEGDLLNTRDQPSAIIDGYIIDKVFTVCASN